MSAGRDTPLGERIRSRFRLIRTYTDADEDPSYMPEITDDDQGKSVIDRDGNHVGLVSDVSDGTAYVEPDDDVPGQLKSKLGWGGSNKDQYALRNDAIDEVTADAVHLRKR